MKLFQLPDEQSGRTHAAETPSQRRGRQQTVSGESMTSICYTRVYLEHCAFNLHTDCDQRLQTARKAATHPQEGSVQQKA